MKTLEQISDGLGKINLMKYALALDGTADFILLPHRPDVPALIRSLPVAYEVWIKDENTQQQSTKIQNHIVPGAHNFVGFREVSNEIYFSRSDEMYFLK